MPITSQIGSSSLIKPGVIDSAATRPASPYEGQVIFQKDTDQLLVWNGTAWVIPNQTTQNPEGLELIKTQTIGTTQSTVSVDDVFSSTYDHYLVTVSGGVGSASIELRIQLGSTTSNYKYQLLYGGYNGTASAEGTSTAVRFPYVGVGTTSGLSLYCHIYTPNKATRTHIEAPYFGPSGTDSGRVTGVLDNTTQYTGFILGTASGTMTGGTIRVYGYRNS